MATDSNDLPSKPVRVIIRVVAILDCLAESPGGLGVTQLSQETGLSKSTVHHLLDTLLLTGLVKVDPTSRRYSLGIKSAQWGEAFLSSIDVRQTAQPFLERLRDLSGETASLHVRIDGSRMCVAQALSFHNLRRVAEIAAPRPLWLAATGHVLMSAMPTAEVIEYLRSVKRNPSTPKSLTAEADILERIEVTRRQGYAISYEENEVGVSAVSVPIFGHGGSIVATLSITGPMSRWNGDTIDPSLPAITEICAELSAALGWRPDERTRADSLSGFDRPINALPRT